MGKRGKRALRVNFDGKLKLEFHGTMISSDAGLLVYRELDETFALTAGLKDMIGKGRGSSDFIPREVAFITKSYSA